MPFFFFHFEQENKEYREFKEKDCREIYAYQVLFGDAFDNEKYATTPTNLCRTGFAMFEDNPNDHPRDATSICEESSSSSDEDDKLDRPILSMDVSDRRSRENRRSDGSKSIEKRTKISVREFSYSVDRAMTTSEKVVAKLDNLVGSNVPDTKTCMKKLFATTRLHKKIDLYFWMCRFLSLK